MSLQLTWQLTLPSLILSGRQLETARRLQLTAIRGDTMHFETHDQLTKCNADKLAVALFRHLKRPVAVVLTQLPHRIQFRSYKDHQGNE